MPFAKLELDWSQNEGSRLWKKKQGNMAKWYVPDDKGQVSVEQHFSTAEEMASINSLAVC